MPIHPSSIISGIKAAARGAELACIIIDTDEKEDTGKNSVLKGQLAVVKACNKLKIPIIFFVLGAYMSEKQKPNPTKKAELKQWMQTATLTANNHPSEVLWSAAHHDLRQLRVKESNNVFKNTNLNADLKFRRSVTQVILMGQMANSCVLSSIDQQVDGGQAALQFGFGVISGKHVVEGDPNNTLSALFVNPNVHWYTSL